MCRVYFLLYFSLKKTKLHIDRRDQEFKSVVKECSKIDFFLNEYANFKFCQNNIVHATILEKGKKKIGEKNVSETKDKRLSCVSLT